MTPGDLELQTPFVVVVQGAAQQRGEMWREHNVIMGIKQEVYRRCTGG